MRILRERRVRDIREGDFILAVGDDPREGWRITDSKLYVVTGISEDDTGTTLVTKRFLPSGEEVVLADLQDTQPVWRGEHA